MKRVHDLSNFQDLVDTAAASRSIRVACGGHAEQRYRSGQRVTIISPVGVWRHTDVDVIDRRLARAVDAFELEKRASRFCARPRARDAFQVPSQSPCR